MKPTECVAIVALINARCPASRLDDATADAWFYDLANVDYTDSREAVLNLSRRQAFIALHELLTETAALTKARLGRQRVLELEAEREAEEAANPPGQIPAGAAAELLAKIGKPVAPATKDELDNERRLAKIAEARAELDAKRQPVS